MKSTLESHCVWKSIPELIPLEHFLGTLSGQEGSSGTLFGTPFGTLFGTLSGMLLMELSSWVGPRTGVSQKSVP